MSLREVGNLVRNYLSIACMLAMSWFVSSKLSQAIDARIMEVGATEHADTLLILFGIVIIFALGFIIYELAKPTIIPSFVLAIFFGIVSGDILSFLTENPIALTTLIVIGSILILFEGGLETPFMKFRSLLGPILSLAFFGTILNAVLLSLIVQSLAHWMGIHIPLPALVLLGAAVASTDPAAIIPSFQSLIFIKPKVKHIAISESAINDVIGAMLVGTFLALFYGAARPINILDAWGMLLSFENLVLISKTIIIGAGVGFIAYLGLHFWSQWKKRVQTEDGSDSALFLAAPLFAFTFASILGGSGYLAVFLSGLFFHMKSHFRHVEHYFNHTIEGFMKPIIFMLLGAMVDIHRLYELMGIGIVAGLAFMFILRPLIVLLTLLPFAFGKQNIHIKEMLFLSFVRETGVIPAALLITIQLADVPGSEIIVTIGLWIILMTLAIQPPLTPLLACKLGLAKDKSSLPQRAHNGPVAVLCSRGFSFPERMETVVNWAQSHTVDNIVLLHCPEEKYSKEFVKDVEKRAKELFRSINKKRVNEGKKEINFEFLCGQGLLQDNIEALIQSGDVSIIFVGCKMLDYRIEDVKRLEVPFFFMS